MHELSIAQSILEIVQQHVPNGQDAAVRTVQVRIGRLSGVVSESLEFGFLAMVHGTPYSGARLDLEIVDVRAHCNRCGVTGPIEPPALFCPACGEAGVKVLNGNELQVVAIELDDTPAEAR